MAEYTFRHFGANLRYGRREENAVNLDFLHFAQRLTEEFSAATMPLPPELRAEYPEYIDYLRYTAGLETAIMSARKHLDDGLDIPLCAISIQQTCKRANDYKRAAWEMGFLREIKPKDSYVALLYAQSLQAVAEWDRLRWLAEDLLIRTDAIPANMASRWAKLLLDTGLPDSATGFLKHVDQNAPESDVLMRRQMLYVDDASGVEEAVPTLVINLPDDVRKKDVTFGMLERAGHRCSVVPGVDARVLPRHALAGLCHQPKVLDEIGAGAVGAALAHIKTWEYVFDHCPVGAVIVEDDAAPYAPLFHALRVIEQNPQHDVVYINERMSKLAAGHELKQEHEMIKPWDHIGSWPASRAGWGFDGYYISAVGVSKLLQIMDHQKIRGHIDGQAGAYGLPLGEEPRTHQQRTLMNFRSLIDDSLQLSARSLAFPATLQNNYGMSTIRAVSREG